MTKYQIISEYYDIKDRFRALIESLNEPDESSSKSKAITRNDICRILDSLNAQLAQLEDDNPFLVKVTAIVEKEIMNENA